jgi:hypothetical protein
MSVSSSEHLTVANPVLAARESLTVPGMANWAGEGPGGKSCAGCALFRKARKPVGQDGAIPRDGRCLKFIRVNRALHGSAAILWIPPETPSCRHFEERA